MKRLVLAALIPLGIALGACATGPGPGTSGNALPPLAGTSWMLRDIAGTPVIDRSEAGIEFLDGQRAAGNTSCNRFTATYETSGGRIKFGPFATTRRGCIGPVADQESRYLKALDGAERIGMEGELLVIHSRGSERPLRFVRKAP